jgi:uncharacterized protein (TIGR02646 family)
MRPIERGDNSTVYLKYQEARSELIARLGQCCSYCECRLPATLDVEHIQPKDINPALRETWTNFLLACKNCNSTKGDQAIILQDYFWVDKDNTARAFVFLIGGVIEVNPSLDENMKIKAQKTMELVGLQKQPPSNKEFSDRRWSNRKETWNMAVDSLQDLNDCNTVQMRQQIVRTAQGQGFWSVWMTVFKDDPDMLERLINAFAGTAKSCFDPVTFQPIPRVGGAI